MFGSFWLQRTKTCRLPSIMSFIVRMPKRVRNQEKFFPSKTCENANHHSPSHWKTCSAATIMCLHFPLLLYIRVVLISFQSLPSLQSHPFWPHFVLFKAKLFKNNDAIWVINPHPAESSHNGRSYLTWLFKYWPRRWSWLLGQTPLWLWPK